MAVDGAEIGKAQLFKQCAANGHALQHILGALGALAERFGQQTDRALGGGLEVLKRLFGIKTAKIGDIAPTGGAIDISLSFRITNSRLPKWPALFIAS